MHLSLPGAPDPYILVLTALGLLIALVAWLPLALRRLPLSLPIVCVLLGAGLFSLPGVTLQPLPARIPEIAERVSEFVVISALMGAGLTIDHLGEHAGNENLAARFPRAARYVDWPMLLAMRLRP